MNEILGIVYGFARAAWRRRWLAIATAWIVAVPAWLLVAKMPDRYEAAASVFVDASTALRPVLEGIALQTDFDSQLALARQQMTSRPQLEAVARDLLPPGAAGNPAEIEALADELQEEIQISSSSTGNSQNITYTIAYQNTDRDKSIKVVQGLVDKLVADTNSGNRVGAAQAQAFLEEQIAAVLGQLREKEKLLAEFKQRNIGQIPGQGGDLIARYDVEQAGLQTAETAIAVSQAEKAKLEEQLAAANVYLPGTSSGGGSGGVPDVTQRRQQAEQEYEALLLKYTERHPQVLALRDQIVALKKAEEDELKILARGGTGTGAIRSLSANPEYTRIKGALAQTEVEIARHVGEARQHRQEIARLSKYVNMAPELEQEYANLTRGYDVTKTQYDGLVVQRQKASVSDDAAESGAITFKIVEPATASLDPVAPKRALLYVVVLFLAIGAGVGLALIPQLISPTFDDAGTLQRKLGLPVLGAISMVYSARQRTHQKWQIFRVTCAAGTLVVIAAVLAAASHDGARMLRALMT